VNSDVVELVLAQFVRAAKDEAFSILAYCFMPDHVHFLIQGDSEWSDCRRLIKLGKQYAGFAYSRKYGGRLWQPWGFERVLRNDEATIMVAKYIVANPVRAGLVKSAADYPFLGSQVFELKHLIDSLPT
jgi:putative transposase